jgi:hypothetical protein
VKEKFFQKTDSELNAQEKWEYKYGITFEIMTPAGRYKIKRPKLAKTFGEETHTM